MLKAAAARAVAAAAAAAASSASSAGSAAAAATSARAVAATTISSVSSSSCPSTLTAAARAASRRFSAASGGGGAAAGAGGGGAPPPPTTNAPKSMLDMSFAHPGAAGEVLGSAAEARLQTLQASEGASASAADGAAASGAGGAAGGAPMGAARRALSVASDVAIVAGLFAVAAGGYLYARHPLAEVEAMLADARERAGYAAEDRRRAAELEAAVAAAAAAAALAAEEHEEAQRREASASSKAGGLFGRRGGGGGGGGGAKKKPSQEQQQQQAAAGGQPSPADAPASAAPVAADDGAPSSSSPSSPLAKAQTWLLERYLSLARPLDAKVREYADPPCDRLLPDLPPEHRGRVKTLVVDLEGVLTHKSWTRGRGWTVYKRPGASEFLQAAAQYYEVVVYTSEPSLYADPVVNRLDPDRAAVAYRLYRQDTQYDPATGEHVRDLSKLNRDLSQVLLLACDPAAWAFQPDNALKLRPWRGPDAGGEEGGGEGGGEGAAVAAAAAAAAGDQARKKKQAKRPDTTLLDLIPFLQMVATKGVADVRDVVRAYDGEPDLAAAFRRRMARLAARKQQQQQG